jgi:hypothetical protein
MKPGLNAKAVVARGVVDEVVPAAGVMGGMEAAEADAAAMAVGAAVDVIAVIVEVAAATAADATGKLRGHSNLGI